MTEPLFPPTSLAEWREEVARELNGADLDRALVSTTREGLKLQPVYPGSAPRDPFVAAACQARLGRPTRLVQPVLAASIAEAHDAVVEELHGGADGVWLRLALGARLGRADVGGTGLWPPDAAAWRGLLGASRPGTLVLDAGANALPVVAALRPALSAETTLLVLSDPYAALAEDGALPASLPRIQAELAELTLGAPGATTLGVSGAAYAEAGADLTLTLGLSLAAAAETLAAVIDAGVPAERAVAALWWSVPMGRDLLMNVAALRAMRGLHTRLARAFGVAAPGLAPLHAAPNAATLTQRDPHTNLLRVTSATFAALVGGADLVSATPFDAPLGQPSALGRRIARNTPQVLLAESHLGDVVDPLGGAPAVEALTDAVGRAAWALLQEISAEGGLSASWRAGKVHERVSQAQRAWTAQLRARKATIVGVSDYVDPTEAPLTRPSLVTTPPGAAALAGGPLRVDRGASALAALQAAAEAGAGVCGLAAALDRDEGEREPPLPSRLDAAPFDALRARVEAAGGPAPRVLLATVGPVGEWKARSTWTLNLLRAGGLDPVEDEGGASPEDAPAQLAARLQAVGAVAAVICVSDARLPGVAGPVAEALRAAGAAQVWVAGRPATLKELSPAPRIDGFVYAGADVVSALDGLLSALGLPEQGSW
ncbi:methylmalonyl-CoA mutase family protein [Myxococcota bacterium]|nr:methylmalonyl-CoA mutase family protein [Myxococcota bacterium]